MCEWKFPDSSVSRLHLLLLAAWMFSQNSSRYALDYLFGGDGDGDGTQSSCLPFNQSPISASVSILFYLVDDNFFRSIVADACGSGCCCCFALAQKPQIGAKEKTCSISSFAST